MVNAVFIEGLIYAMMVLGVFMTFRILDFPDMTVDGSFATGACVAAMFIVNGADLYLGLAAAIIAGITAGVFTALLHTLLKIPNLLAGIITMTMLYSINTRITSGSSFVPLPNNKYDTAVTNADNAITGFFGSFGVEISSSISILIFFLLLIIYIKILVDIFFRTDLGISLGALGSNEQMILSQGMNPNVLKVLGVGISNGLVALSGAMYAQFTGSASVQSGQGIIIVGLAAVMIGEFLIRSNKIWLITLGVIIGSIIYKAIIYFGLKYGYDIGLGPNDLKLISGILIILIIVASKLQNKKGGSKKTADKKSSPVIDSIAFVIDGFINKTYPFWFLSLYLILFIYPVILFFQYCQNSENSVWMLIFILTVLFALFIHIKIFLMSKFGAESRLNMAFKKVSFGINKRSKAVAGANTGKDYKGDNVLVLQNVSKSFFEGTPDEKQVLKNLSLTVNKGDFITIIGSNGAGKSTLFNVIAGTYKASSGNIIYKMKNITKMPEYLKAAFIGRIFQNPLLGTSGDMALEDNMILCRKKGFKLPIISLNKKVRKEFADHAARLNMGLEKRLGDNVGLFSGGQRQALTLLMTAMSHPELVLLDEHTAALDPDNSNRVMELTLQLREEYGLTMMMITHNMQHAIKYGNRLLMMDNGEIIMDISGKEKENLTVEAIMEKFKAIRKDELTDEKLLLTR